MTTGAGNGRHCCTPPQLSEVPGTSRDTLLSKQGVDSAIGEASPKMADPIGVVTQQLLACKKCLVLWYQRHYTWKYSWEPSEELCQMVRRCSTSPVHLAQCRREDGQGHLFLSTCQTLGL